MLCQVKTNQQWIYGDHYEPHKIRSTTEIDPGPDQLPLQSLIRANEPYFPKNDSHPIMTMSMFSETPAALFPARLFIQHPCSSKRRHNLARRALVSL
ncbi:hypothetical protein HZ326_1669 [Fusarium oxysporum f. sp. albedinis]|nr:hypothetical protein HZ326_1669 [Fusarium oxysporum f. sp. albedinis]